MSDTKVTCCYTCKFFKPADDDSGQCRRYPPVLCDTAVKIGYLERLNGREVIDPILAIDEASGSTPWASPRVFGEDWCGEYRPVEPPQSETA